ncbi:unnamed protein product [Rhodiola kirilowii]
MGELSAPNFRNQPWCIYEGPELEGIVINSAVVHHLPKFSGRQGESATTHLQRLHDICQNLRPYGVEVEDFKLKAFYFPLIDAANDWFLSLPSGSIQTWDQMQKKFLNKYYPAGRAMQVRKQIHDLRQEPNESMYDYLEKFNHLEQSCCNLGLPEKLVIEYLLDGLRPLDSMLLDASARGTIMNLPLGRIRKLIADVAENARFREETNRQEEFGKTKNVARADTPVNPMAEELRQMKEMMQQIIRRQSVQAKPCEFCGATDHKIDACPTIVEEDQGEVNAVDGYHNYNNRVRPSRQYGQAAKGQNWRNANHAQRESAQAQQYYRPPYRQQQGGYNGSSQYQPRGQNQNQAGPSHQGSSKSLEDIVKELATTVHQYQAKTEGTLTELSKQMSNLAQTIFELKRDPGRLPSQTVPNPRGNVSTLAVVDVDASLKESAYWVNRMLALDGHIDAENEVTKESTSDQIVDDVHFSVIRGPLKDTAPVEINCESPAAGQSSADEEHLISADEEHFSPRMEHLKCSRDLLYRKY